MCGIIGFVSPGASSHDPEKLLQSLHHRGPDSQGTETFSLWGATVWLGQTRLAIVDLSSAGHQPMLSRDGRWCLTYNGEFYNHQDVRRELGGSYRGHSDTETLVEALAAWGVEQALPRINGMFGFAALDRHEGNLYLARDPFGIKPLYYAPLPGGGLAFASEARALRPLLRDEQSWEVDQESLQTFMTLRYVPSPNTLWRGIYRLPPGYFLTYDLKTGRIERCAQCYIEPNVERFSGSFDEAVQSYHEVLAAAVERQMLSDVPVGLLLSGGIDSALVAALANAGGRDLETYTVGFGAENQECELDDAAHTAKVLGLPHHEVKVTPDELWQALPAVVSSVEEPLGTTSILPMWHLVHRARKDVTVVLTGQGSDEPWGGYLRYQAEIVRSYLPLPQAFSFASRLRLPRGPEFVERALRSLPHVDVARRFEEAYALFTQEERLALSGRSDSGRAAQDIGRWLDWAEPAKCEPVEQMMRIDSRMNLADDLLLYGDKIAMATSLEARVPMLDLEVVRFIESLPRRYRVALRSGKICHKAMARRYLPAAIVERPKKGFKVPFEAWSRGPWKEGIADVLFDREAPHLAHLNRKALERMWNEHIAAKRDHSRKLFALLMLATWWREQVKAR